MQLWAEAQRAQFQMAVQQAQAQQAQAQQQADVQANMDAQQAEQEMATQQSQNMAGPQGIPGVEGQGYNPAQGGTIPAQVNPEATREMQNGQAIEAMEALR